MPCAMASVPRILQGRIRPSRPPAKRQACGHRLASAASSGSPLPADNGDTHERQPHRPDHRSRCRGRPARIPAAAIQPGRLGLGFGDDPDLGGASAARVPTALLTGANHGDEYEGPIALQELAADARRPRKRPRDHRAVHELSRHSAPAYANSPIDRGNLNRSFPGRPDGTRDREDRRLFHAQLLPKPISCSISIPAVGPSISCHSPAFIASPMRPSKRAPMPP